jgi:polygalacturonase
MCKSRARYAALLAAAHGVAATSALADPVLPTIPNHTFNIVDFGASTANTPAQNLTAINATISACNSAGGGTITVPAGTFVSSPGIVVGNNTDLELLGTLQAPAFASYGSASTNFLTFNNAHDVGLSGSGTLNGAATFSSSSSDPEWWGGSGLSPPGTRPRLLRINSSTRFLFKGVHIKNAPSFHVSFSGSNSEFTLDGLSVNAPSNAPNTDAIDVTGTNGLIKNCNISVGDDNIVMKPQSTHCANVEVATCTFGTGHGVSIGGQTNAGMDGFNVHDCTFNGTSNGIHLKAGRGDGGLVTNLTFSNLTMTNVSNPFDVSSYYINGGDVAGPLTPTHIPSGGTQAGAPVLADLPKTFIAGSTPQWQNVTFRNIHINGTSSNNFFYGTPEATIQNLVLSDVIYQNTPGNGLNFVNDADVHWTGATVAPVQCARIASMELSGASTAAPAALSQSFSSSLASQAITLKGNASLYTNFDPNFDPASVNTVSISGDLDLGKSTGTAGLYNLTGGSLSVGGNESIGNGGTGTLTQTGGYNGVVGHVVRRAHRRRARHVHDLRRVRFAGQRAGQLAGHVQLQRRHDRDRRRAASQRRHAQGDSVGHARLPDRRRERQQRRDDRLERQRHDRRRRHEHRGRCCPRRLGAQHAEFRRVARLRDHQLRRPRQREPCDQPGRHQRRRLHRRAIEQQLRRPEHRRLGHAGEVHVLRRHRPQRPGQLR